MAVHLGSNILLVALFLVVLVQSFSAALQWSATPRDGDVLYPCADHDLTLAWDFTLEEGDTVTLIEWTYKGNSQEVVAMTAHGIFFSTPAFSHRVERISQAGLLLRHVILGDSGNYSVSVMGTLRSGLAFQSSRTVLVQVAEALMTDDHELQARQEAVAVFSNNTGQWHIVISCGHFTFAGSPPLAVDWTTPGGQIQPSTLFEDGYFRYLLPNPVQGGTYTCSLSLTSANASCSGNNSLHGTVHVSAVLARLSLIEAEQHLMEHRLKEEIARKDAELQALRDDLSDVRSEVDAHFGVCSPAFHTVIRDAWRLTSVGVGGQCDNNLTSGWYRFMVNSSSAVLPTSCVPVRQCQTGITTWLDLQGQSLPQGSKELQARVCSHWISGCCQWQAPTLVRNCGSFFVYKLQPIPDITCSHAYCVDLQR